MIPYYLDHHGLRYCAASMCQRECRRLRIQAGAQQEADIPATARNPISAACYIRMSTEHQNYSLEHQLKAISEYASAHGLEVVRHYQDLGRSGFS